MDPSYETVVDPTTIVWTLAAMGIHGAMVASQVAVILYLLATALYAWLAPAHIPRWLRRLGVIDPGNDARGAFVATRAVLGLALLLPVAVGASFVVSLVASVGAIGVLTVHERRLGDAELRPGLFSRRLAIAATALVAAFALWEREDGLALGLELTINAQTWRVHELDWQLANDLEAPKVGDLAPDFALQAPDGNVAVRLSDFRGKRPVALAFGSYT